MATSDLEGLDPAGAKTPEAFMQLLRQARTDSGLSLVEIADRARKRGYELDPVGLAQALDQPTLPSWQVVTGLLTACGLAGMQIDRWMRVYHDFASPAEPVFAAAPMAAPVEEPADVEPVSVPPLLLTTTEHRPARVAPRHLAIAGGVVVVLVMAPLLLFFLLNNEPQGIAAAPTSTPPRTVILAPPPSPTDLPVELSPTPTAAVPTTPGPVRTTPGPVRTTAAPPPPPPSPNPPSPADPGVFRSGTASLTDFQSVDLDGGGSDIVRLDDDVLAGTNSARRLELFTRGQPTKQDCQGISDWERSVNSLDPGDWLCVRTNQNRLGRINISLTGDTLKLSYTIWN